MSKVALITDLHGGARNDNRTFLDYFREFYQDQFFPYIQKNGIKTVVCLGDTFDRRKSINYYTLKCMKEMLFDPIQEMGLDFHVLAGNHDITYRNTNSVNALELLLNDYNFSVYIDEGKVVDFYGTNVLMMPWINPENYAKNLKIMETANAGILFGHLELQGFQMNLGSVCLEGMDKALFDRFEIVCSGHFHHKSSKDNINYLGTPYEITWADYNDPRGFHIMDMNTRQLKFIRNPKKMFNKIFYNDVGKDLSYYTDMNIDYLKDRYVKVIVQKKENNYWFDLLLDRLYKVEPLKLQVIEDVSYDIDNEDIIEKGDDTITTLKKYVKELEIDNNQKKGLDSLLQSLYDEALSTE